MKKIKEFIALLQPQSRIQNLLEELNEVILADIPLTKTGIALYLPSSTPIHAEAVKRDSGEVVKTFRMASKELSGNIEDGMSTIEITDENEIMGRIYLWRGRIDRSWDFRSFVPYLELVRVVLRKARIEWAQKDTLDKIADMLVGEEKDTKKQRESEEISRRLNDQVVKLDKNLQEKETEFLNLFNLSKDGLFIIDSEGRYLAVNKSACELLGCTKDEILRMNAFRQNTGRSGICWKVGLGVERCEIVTPRGNMITVEVSLTPFRYQGEDCFLGTMRGLPGPQEPINKAGEQEPILADEKRMKDETSLALFDSLNDAVLVMDENGIIIYCNKSAEGIFGYPKGEIVGQALTRFMPERYRELQLNALYQLMGNKETGIRGELVEAEGLRVDGEEFPLEFSLSPIQKNGQRQFLSIIRDLSNKQIL